MGLTVTGYGGVGEIGGNAFLLDDGRTRLLLDVGRRFGAAAVESRWDEAFNRRPGFGDFFDAYLKARSFAAARDLMALDLVPALPTLYRQDLGGSPGAAPVDGILVSHAHQDHFGLLGLVRHDVPVLASPESLATFGSLEETGTGGWETDLVEVRLRGGVQRRADGELTVGWQYGRATKSRPAEEGPRRPYLTGGTATFGRWTVTQHAVDHSIQGATGFVLVRDDGHKVVYTGDFRSHGRNPRLTESFLRAAQDPDVLLVEGTRVDRRGGAGEPRTDAEAEVEAEIEAYVHERERTHGPGFVGIGYPIRDLDRLVSVWTVARHLGRRLVLQPKQAHLLAALRRAGRTDLPDPRRDRHLAVYLKAQDKGTVLRRGAPLLVGNKATLAIDTLHATPEQWVRLVTSELPVWERRLLGADGEDDAIPLDASTVTPLDVAAAPRDYLFTLSYWNMTDLFDVFPERERADGLYIHSQTQPFNDDLELTQFKLRRWLAAFHLEGPRETHVSGHADEATLHRVLEELKPKTLVPIHTESPGATADWYSHRIGRRALLPQPGIALQLAS